MKLSLYHYSINDSSFLYHLPCILVILRYSDGLHINDIIYYHVQIIYFIQTQQLWNFEKRINFYILFARGNDTFVLSFLEESSSFFFGNWICQIGHNSLANKVDFLELRSRPVFPKLFSSLRLNQGYSIWWKVLARNQWNIVAMQQ